MMKNCLKIELKKALFNRMTLFTLVAEIVMMLIQVLENILLYHESYRYYESYHIMYGSMSDRNPTSTSMSLFINWFGADLDSFMSSVFYFVLPIIVVLPYGWSLVEELRSGYTKNILCRTGRRIYFASKYMAVFLSGAVIVLIPLVLNVIIMAFFLPALTPEIIYPYGIMSQRSVWSDIYYTQPLIYTCLNILLDSMFGGFIASISTATACLVKNKIAVMVTPFFLLVAMDYLDNTYWAEWDVSPLKFLRALPTAGNRSGIIIFLTGTALLVITAGMVAVKGETYEVL